MKLVVSFPLCDLCTCRPSCTPMLSPPLSRSACLRRPLVARAVNATVGAVSFVVVLPVVVFADVLEDDGNCSIVWPEPAEVWKASFIVYTSTVGFLCPLLVICLCYLLIVVKVTDAMCGPPNPGTRLLDQ